MLHPFRTLLYELLVEPFAELWRKTIGRKSLVTPRSYSDSESRPETRWATSEAGTAVSTEKASPDKKPAKTATKKPAA